MSIQVLYPSGIPILNTESNWRNYDGSEIVDGSNISEGVSTPDNRYVVDNVSANTSKDLWMTCGPLFLQPEKVIFKARMMASGDLIVPDYNVRFNLYAKSVSLPIDFMFGVVENNIDLSDMTDLEIEYLPGSWDQDWDLSNIGWRCVVTTDTATNHSGIIIEAAEILMSGGAVEFIDNIPLYIYDGTLSPLSIKPEQNCDLKDYTYLASGYNYSFNNRFRGHVDEIMPSAIFNLGYFEFNESGNVYYPVQDNLDISGVLRYPDGSLVDSTYQYNYYRKQDTPINPDYEEDVNILNQNDTEFVDFKLGQKLGVGSFLHSGISANDMFIHFNSGLLNRDSWSVYFNIHHSGTPFSIANNNQGQVLFENADHEGDISSDINSSGSNASFYIEFTDVYSLVGVSG